MKEIKLPSGATLKITPSPFADAKALYQALLREVRQVGINSQTEMGEIFKNLFCMGFSSPEVEAKLLVCFKRCVYNSGKGDLKIDESTFEPIEARDDYMKVCMEVTRENVLPFVKSLYAEYQTALATIESAQS